MYDVSICCIINCLSEDIKLLDLNSFCILSDSIDTHTQCGMLPSQVGLKAAYLSSEKCCSDSLTQKAANQLFFFSLCEKKDSRGKKIRQRRKSTDSNSSSSNNQKASWELTKIRHVYITVQIQWWKVLLIVCLSVLRLSISSLAYKGKDGFKCYFTSNWYTVHPQTAVLYLLYHWQTHACSHCCTIKTLIN